MIIYNGVLLLFLLHFTTAQLNVPRSS